MTTADRWRVVAGCTELLLAVLGLFVVVAVWRDRRRAVREVRLDDDDETDEPVTPR